MERRTGKPCPELALLQAHALAAESIGRKAPAPRGRPLTRGTEVGLTQSHAHRSQRFLAESCIGALTSGNLLATRTRLKQRRLVLM